MTKRLRIEELSPIQAAPPPELFPLTENEDISSASFPTAKNLKVDFGPRVKTCGTLRIHAMVSQPAAVDLDEGLTYLARPPGDDDETTSYHLHIDDEISEGSDIDMAAAYGDTNANDHHTLPGDIKNYILQEDQVTTSSRLGDGEFSIADDVPRCFVNIRNPKVGTCQHEFSIPKELRYRKAVSDFFGRNKTATASIPIECYPVICRTCYQNTHYRLTNMDHTDPAKCDAADADIKCDIII